MCALSLPLKDVLVEKIFLTKKEMNSWLDSAVWAMVNYPHGEWIEGIVKNYKGIENKNGFIFDILLINQK